MAADPGLMTEVETELARARDMSETRSVGELREAVGAGHDDLLEVLEELRVGGKISEVAPGESLPFDSNAAARESAATRREEADPPEPGVSLAEAERSARTGQTPRPRGEDSVRVQLDAAVAAVMD